MFIGKHMHATCISMRCYDGKAEEIFQGTIYALIASPEDLKSLRPQSFDVKTAFCQI